jgi:hypothetical protein
MQFLLFDVSATLVFLGVYLATVSLRRRVLLAVSPRRQATRVAASR